MPYLDLILDFIQTNLIAIYFASGSLLLFVLILLVDRFIQRSSSQNQTTLDLDRTETSNDISEEDALNDYQRGVSSLQRALDDNIVTDDEHAKLLQELKDKYHQ